MNETTTTDQRALAARIRACMAYREINAPQLAAMVGTTRQSIWRYMSGRHIQSFWTVAKIAKALRVKLDYLAYGEGGIE